ncbi:MurR/RpiR family transcriptional regulator [Staphylococcus gallinarum]|uniref:MurR/RpiR family transcriptional regulator n=1 Tax=Staphylococcus gallinarum TaxID=1293 RepID=A0A3A0W7B2_STAGA|nr:MurR/RpiR family transcriptional regulator [Staphylococcus gallinarum]RIP37427.1 MurR/RpiR family transcriptional regulator [Staphylococcus gallinarum]
MTNLLYKIDKQYPSFTKSEKKIADFILNTPHKIITMSVQDLSLTIDTSTASIVRFSKKVTGKGFQELKIALSRYLPEDTTNNTHLELVANESVDTLKSKMLSRATDTMNFVAATIDSECIDEICHVLKHARNIFIFGYGASYVIATDLFQKLSRIGLNVRLVQETHLFITTLATHDSQDCIIFITNQGSHSELRSMASVASDYNIPIITISSTSDNPIAQVSNYKLIYGQTDENELRMAATTSLFAQLFSVDVLYYRYIALNYESALDSITQSKMALNNYRKHLSLIKFKH